MIRRGVVVCSLLLAAILPGVSFASSPADEAGVRLAASVRPAVVRVEGLMRRRATSSSGVLLGRGDLVLTWSRVSAPGRTVSVILFGGERRSGKVVMRDGTTGVTLVELTEKTPGGLVASGRELVAGEPVAGAGHPFRAERGDGGSAVGLGIVAQVRRVPGSETDRRYILSSAVNPGEAGGPLVDRAGRLAGVLLAEKDESSGFSMAVPISTLRLVESDDAAAAGTWQKALEPAGDAEAGPEWPVHDRLREMAEIVCPAVVSLVSDAEGTRAATALLIDREGHALTTKANLEGLTNLRAVFPDGREFPAVKLGEDLRLGIAMIRIEADEYPPVPELSAGNPRLGSFVVALGNPNGRGAGSGCLMTMGLIGARDRTDRPDGPLRYRALHTDAGVNQGNLGGPLVNLDGRVVGILSSLGGKAIRSVGANSGVGFAIPMRDLIPRLEAMRKSEKIAFRPGYLGVRLSFDPQPGRGVLVTAVLPGRPAATAGIEANDVIVGANGRKIDDFEGLRRVFSELQAGERVPVSIRRGTETRDVEVTLGDWE